jgi:hypothetical protein
MTNNRRSRVTDEAESRIAALSTIQTRLKFPDSLTMQGYITQATEARALVAQLNSIDANRDATRSLLDKAEQELATTSSRVLKAVLAQFGPDSPEYALAGGTRTSDRKRGTRRPEDANPEPPSAATAQAS